MLLAVLGLSISIGVSLGLLGGGGSILTVPILTYVAGMSAKTAIASSLFVVGVTSAAGILAHARAGRVQWRTGMLFGTAGMAGAYAGGHLGAFIPGQLLMILFGVMMAVTAVAMLRKRRDVVPRRGDLPIAKVLGNGAGVGLIAGIVGAGGGFLIVPALVLRGGLSMPLAIGTSLVVISMQSFAGFIGHLGYVTIDWPLTIGVTVAAVIGSLIGGSFVGRIAPAALRRGFGWLIVAMSVLVLARELFCC
ncbi:MAG TPA: sulfite exporter TauE/SafE family protein [Kofleriaceae bacterium]|jgi:uncharacterized membrane protein YfcA|nr:sulfite exporter TauE/SafE family protein [Kofleriaceae bacterium]